MIRNVSIYRLRSDMASHSSYDEWWQNTVTSQDKIKTASIEAERQAHRDEASELGRNALPQTTNRRRIESINPREPSNASKAPTPQTFPITPPDSPSDQRNSRMQASSVSQPAETLPSRITLLQESINQLQNQIHQQTLQSESIRGDIQFWRKQRRESTAARLAAIQSSTDQEIGKYKKRENELVKMIKERETRIEELEDEIESTKTRESEFKRQLREAKSKAADDDAETQRRERWWREELEHSEARVTHAAEEGRKREEVLANQMKAVEDRNDSFVEHIQKCESQMEKQLQDAKKATEEIKNAKSVSIGVEKRNLPWEFRRRKDLNTTTLSAACRTGLRIIWGA